MSAVRFGRADARGLKAFRIGNIEIVWGHVPSVPRYARGRIRCSRGCIGYSFAVCDVVWVRGRCAEDFP